MHRGKLSIYCPFCSEEHKYPPSKVKTRGFESRKRIHSNASIRARKRLYVLRCIRGGRFGRSVPGFALPPSCRRSLRGRGGRFGRSVPGFALPPSCRRSLRADADFLQVLLGEVREHPLVDLVVAECRLVSSRPRLRSQTTMSMTAPTIGGGGHHLSGKRECLGWHWSSQGFAEPR
jgi:hypothetical protein